MKRKLPDTSISAYKGVTIEMLNNHHSKIIKALKELGSGTYEEIANWLGWDDKNRASRRLLEMEKLELVWKPGGKKSTKSGRLAYIYHLRGDQFPKTDEAEKNQFKGQTTTADYANKIIKESNHYTQSNLNFYE